MVASVASAKPAIGLRPQVLAYLKKNGNGSAREIAEALSAHPVYISQMLLKLMGQGALVNYERGRYRLDPDFQID